MTIQDNGCVVTVTGNSAQTVFSYGFQIPIGAGFELILTNTTTGGQSVVSTSNYSISGLGNASGGTFTYPLVGSPITSENTLTLVRQVAYAQTTNFANQDGYYPQAVDLALDNLAMQGQQLEQLASLAIHQPQGDTLALNPLPTAVQRANTMLGFDANGQLVLVPT